MYTQNQGSKCNEIFNSIADSSAICCWGGALMESNGGSREDPKGAGSTSPLLRSCKVDMRSEKKLRGSQRSRSNQCSMLKPSECLHDPLNNELHPTIRADSRWRRSPIRPHQDLGPSRTHSHSYFRQVRVSVHVLGLRRGPGVGRWEQLEQLSIFHYPSPTTLWKQKMKNICLR